VLAVHALLPRLQPHHHHQLGVQLHHLLPLSTPVSAPATTARVRDRLLPLQRHGYVIWRREASWWTCHAPRDVTPPARDVTRGVVEVPRPRDVTPPTRYVTRGVVEAPRLRDVTPPCRNVTRGVVEVPRLRDVTPPSRDVTSGVVEVPRPS